MNIRKINDLIQIGEYDTALESIDKLIIKDQLTGEIIKSKIFFLKGDLKKSVILGKISLQKAYRKGSTLQKLQAILFISYNYVEQGKWAQLAENIKEGEILLESLDDKSDSTLRDCESLLDFLKCQFHFAKGDIQVSLDFCKNSLQLREKENLQRDIAEILITTGWIHLWGTGSIDEALACFQKALKISKSLSNETQIAHSFNGLAIYHSHRHENKKNFLYLGKAYEIYERLQNKLYLAFVHHNYSFYYNKNNEYEKALYHLKKADEVSKELDSKDMAAYITFQLGYTLSLKGQLDRALEYFFKALELREEIGLSFGILGRANILRNIGGLFLMKGELDTAIEFYSKSIESFSKTNRLSPAARGHLAISSAYALKGEPTLALNHVTQALETFRSYNDVAGIQESFCRIGIIHKILGNYDKAIEFLEKAKKGVNDEGTLNINVFFALFQLVLVANECDSYELAKKSLDEMKSYKIKPNNYSDSLRIRFAEAIVLKMNKRGRKKLQAQQIFYEIINSNISISNEITSLAMLNLCELLILEMTISEADIELLQEIEDLSERLIDSAQRQNSSSLKVMALMLRARLLLVNIDFQKANDLLEDAKTIAEEKNLGGLLKKILSESNKLHDEVDKWEEISLKNTSLKERIKKAHLKSYIFNAKKIQESLMVPLTEDQLQ